MKLNAHMAAAHKQIDVVETLHSPTDSSIHSSKSILISKQLLSKSSKNRHEAINEIFKLFSHPECKDSTFLEYSKELAKCLSDVDYTVQDKALDVLLVLLEKYNLNDTRNIAGCVAALIEKCLKSPRSQLKNKAVDCILLMAESTLAQGIMKEYITETLGAKNLTKIAPCLITTLTQLLVTYGNASFPVRDFAPLIVPLTESPNMQLRDEALKYLREGYSWDSMTIIKAIKTFKPYQSEELNKLLGITINSARSPRLLNNNIRIDTAKPSCQTRNTKKLHNSTYRKQPNEANSSLKNPMTPVNNKQILTIPTLPNPVQKHKKHASLTIPEDNLITIEDATKEVFNTIPINILAYFDMPSWNEREKGFEEFIVWIQKNPNKAQPVMERAVIWLKRKFFNFTECSSQAAKQWLMLIKTFSNVCVASKTFAQEVVSGLIERMADSKVLEVCLDILLSIADSVTPSYIVRLAITSGYASKNPLIIKAVMILLERMLEGYGATLLPMKVTIDYAKYCLSHVSPQVRNVAISYMVAAYELIGDSINQWLMNDLNETMYKTLQAEFMKVKQNFSSGPKETVDYEELKKDSISLDEYKKEPELQRVNISSKLTPKLIQSLSDSSIKQRQEAKETIEKILLSANNKILPVGINPLLNALKGRLNDPSKSLAKGFVTLVGNLIVTLGRGFGQCNRSIIPALIANIGDKQLAIRDEIVVALDKIVSIGPEFVLKSVGSFLEKENLDIRLPLLQWLMKHKELLNRVEAKGLVESAIKATKDANKEVRELAEEVVREIIVESDTTSKVTNKLDNTLNSNKSEVSAVPAKMNKQLSTQMIFDNAIQVSIESRKTNIVHNATKSQITRSTSRRRLIEERSNAPKKSIITNKIINSPSKGKNQRLESDRTLTSEVSIDQLKNYFKGKISTQLYDNMFSGGMKETINAGNILTEGLNNEFFEILSMSIPFYKWIAIRMSEYINNAVIKVLLDFLTSLFKKLQDEKCKISDREVGIILPVLCEKTAINNSELKQQIVKLIRVLCQIYSPVKITNSVLNILKTTKNKRVKLECLGLIKELTRKYSINRSFPLKEIKNCIECLNTSDSAFKVLALEILAEVCKSLNGTTWELTSKSSNSKKVSLRNELSSINVTDPKQASNVNSTATVNPPTDQLMKSHRNNSSAEKKKTLNTKTCSGKKPIHRTVLSDSIFSSPVNKPEPSDIEFSGSITESISVDFSNTQKSPEQVDKNMALSPLNLSIGQDETLIRFDTLEQALDALKAGYISDKVHALMYLNEKVTSSLDNEKELLICHCDHLLVTFAEIIKECFSRPINEIPLRFVKYFITVVSKICSNKQLIKKTSRESAYLFAEQLIGSLLYEGLENTEEGEYLLKAFNSIMLRLLDNWNPTVSFITFINLFKTYRSPPNFVGNINTSKFPSLILKCVLKLTNNMELLIESMDVAEVLLCLHDFLQLSSEGSLNDPNGRAGIRMAKTIVNELVRARGELLWEDYKKAKLEEKQEIIMKKWVNLILASTHPAPLFSPKSPEKPSDELNDIFKQINSQATFKDGIKRLSEYLSNNPQVDLSPYFVSCSKPFKMYIMESLKKLEKKGSLNEDRSLSEMSPSTIESQKDSPASMSDYKSKLELLKQKFEPNKDGNKNYKTNQIQQTDNK